MVESGIFISYRREDSAGHAGRLYDRLSAHFGEEKIFMDVGIEPGVDFVDQLEEAVASCDVLLVLIGPEWLTADDGRRRLEEEGDFVHLEVSAALERDIRVIPLLVHGATMPAAHDLPPDLARLARRNALELSDARWRYDVGRLIEVLDRLLEPAAPDTPAREAEVAPEPASRSAPEREPVPRHVPDSEPVSRSARVVEPEAVPVPAREPATGDPPEPEPTSPPPLPPARSRADPTGDRASARGTERRIHRTRRRSPLLVAAGVAAAAIVAIALAAGQILGGDEEQGASGGVAEAPPNVVRLGADTGPDAVAVDADSVYVTESRRGTLARIDRQTGELDAERAEVGADPDSIASGAGALWITSTADDRLYAFPLDGSKSTSVGTESRPEGVAVDGNNVWVANSRSGTASRFRLPDLTQND